MKEGQDLILYGYFGHKNAGDELILNSFLRLYPNCTVFSDSKKKGTVSRVSLWRIFNKKKIVFPGGNIFQNKSSSKSLFFYLGFILLCKLTGKKIYLINNGFGPINGKISFYIFKRIMLLCDFISCRTINDLKYMSFYKKSVLGADSFFLNIDNVSLTRGSKTAYIPKSRYLCNEKIPENMDILAMEPYDADFFLEKYPKKNIIKIYDKDINEIKKIFSDYKIIIAVPLHGLILSYYFGIENIFTIIYDEKVLNFCREIEGEVNIIKNIDDFKDIKILNSNKNIRSKIDDLRKRALSFQDNLNI